MKGWNRNVWPFRAEGQGIHQYPPMRVDGNGTGQGAWRSGQRHTGNGMKSFRKLATVRLIYPSPYGETLRALR